MFFGLFLQVHTEEINDKAVKNLLKLICDAYTVSKINMWCCVYVILCGKDSGTSSLYKWWFG